MIKLKLIYTDKHIEYRICTSVDDAEWMAHMEGDHLLNYEIINNG